MTESTARTAEEKLDEIRALCDEAIRGKQALGDPDSYVWADELLDILDAPSTPVPPTLARDATRPEGFDEFERLAGTHPDEAWNLAYLAGQAAPDPTRFVDFERFRCTVLGIVKQETRA